MSEHIHTGGQRRLAAGLDADALRAVALASFRKLSPRQALRSPVMAVVLLGTVLSALITAVVPGDTGFGIAVTLVLFVTVLFA
ncbi:MAG: hypothetical protein HOQ32_14390, partial [Lysobacter sp.]|nr:hypothetical protein [Lysobacter sp.]